MWRKLRKVCGEKSLHLRVEPQRELIRNFRSEASHPSSHTKTHFFFFFPLNFCLDGIFHSSTYICFLFDPAVCERKPKDPEVLRHRAKQCPKKKKKTSRLAPWLLSQMAVMAPISFSYFATFLVTNEFLRHSKRSFFFLFCIVVVW